MASRQKNGRALASPGMAGFLVPPFSLSLSANTLLEASAQGTDIGVFTFTPPDASLTLLDNDGGKFQLNADGITLEAGAVTTEEDVDTDASVHLRLSAHTYIAEFTFPITVTAIPVTNISLSGTKTVQTRSAAGTIIGALTSTPAGANFAIQNDPTGKFSIAGGNLELASTIDYLTDGTNQGDGSGSKVDITLIATHEDQTFTKTFTIDIATYSWDVTTSGEPFDHTAVTVGETLGTFGIGPSTPAGTIAYVLDPASGTQFSITGTSLKQGATLPTGAGDEILWAHITLDGHVVSDSSRQNISYS